MPALTDKLNRLLQKQPPAGVNFGEVGYKAGSTFGPRVQQDVQLVIVQNGELSITVDGKTHRVIADHACCLHPGKTESFTFSPTAVTHHSWVALHFEPVSRGMRLLLADLPFCLPMTRRLTDLMDLGLGIMRRKVAGDGPVLLHLGAAVFLAYAAAAEADTTDRPVPEPVAKARRHIESHYTEPLELADVAKAAGVTDNHIVRLFSKHLGHTPMRYLWRVRVQRGADLLRDTGLSISEIAYRVGFSTPYHFSRLVKQHMGVSPKQLRQSHWNPPGG